MPVVTLDDVAAGFKSLWDKSHVPDASLVPGGLHYQRAPNTTSGVYAVYTVEEGESEEFSGLTYIQKFTVRAAAYAQSGVSGPETDEKRRAMEAALRRTSQMTVPNADQVLHVKPAGGALEYANQMREAQNVVIASGAWEVLVQATR